MNGGMSIEMYLAERDESRAPAELQRRVWEELKCEPGLDGSDLSVDVRERVATLDGSVTSYPQKVAAERAAKCARGLRAVHSHIIVALPPDAVRSDEDLAREVQQALAIDVLIPHEGVEVSVDGGRVRLAGEVPSGLERRAVEQLVGTLIGVRGIDNLITVRPATEPRHLGARVEDALRHDPVLRGDRIQVEAFGDVVIMRGHVRSLAEQEEAEQAAALVSGVRAVRDALKVHG
jgi:osmotically-inducible protein OsmY